MVARVFLHVRKLDSGRVVVTPVPFCDLSRDAGSVPRARARALDAATARVHELDGMQRADLAADAEGALDSIRVSVLSDGDTKQVDATLGLVIVTRERSEGRILMAYLPGLGRWSVAARDRKHLHELARRSLESALTHWPAAGVLALEHTGDISLEAVTIPLEPNEERPTSGIEASGDDLVALAARGRLGRLDRRDPLVERVLAVLAAEGRASVLLVGPSDVGKSALVHEIAARLSTGEVPPGLVGRKLLRISANELIAGARFTGMWQQRARDLIAFARDTGAIVAMGDPGGIVDAGRWSESDNNLGRILRPYVERGELRLICEATADDVATASKREPSFIEVLYRIDVPEPDAGVASEILQAAARRIEANHAVRFAPDAVQSALELTSRFEPYRALPGKAVRLLEETAQLTSDGDEAILAREQVTRAFAQRTGMPLAMLSDDATIDLAQVRAFFEERVLGQDEALEAVVDLVAVVKAALNDPGKPLSTLLFIGPTGVGKTELTKALAEYLFGSRDRVIRFDMGEFASGDALPKLIGSAWERDGEGELTRRVKEQPFCVLLLDEIEKAHRGVFDVLLSALGEGRLTDASGVTADLRNAIVIMTSNLGATRQQSGGIGFGHSEAGDQTNARRAHFIEEAERFFRPEFVNRIDRILSFDPLGQDTIRKIARREIGRLLLREGITRRQLLVEIDDRVVDRLATAGFHSKYGARPLHREIERAVIRPLARLIVQKRPRAGDLIRLDVTGGEVAVSIHDVHEPARPPTVQRQSPPPETPTVAKAKARAEAVLQLLRDEQAAPAAVSMSDQLSQLLTVINRPDFWDDPAAARATMSRVYQLQSVADRLTHLRNRAEGLAELARQLHGRRDHPRLAELNRALTEIREQFMITRLECAGVAAGEDEPEVVMSFAPLTADAAPWAEQVLAMYAAWAERTGRDARRQSTHTPQLRITGPGTHALLATEAGLHRLDLPKNKRHMVRVTVDPYGHSIATTEPPDQGPGQVVRVYSDGARTGVRDPRTNASLGNLRAVLEQGEIDELLLAALAISTPVLPNVKRS